MLRKFSIPLLAVCSLLAGCGSPEPIKVGFLAGLTGSVSELGIGARRALEMSVAEVNASGGIRGRPLELVIQDDGNDPAQGLTAYQRFEKEQVTAVIGPVASTVLGTVLPYLNEHHIVTVSPTASAVLAAGKDDWFFRVITLNRKFGETLGVYALERGLTDVAVLRETSNDAYTRPILEAFQETLRAGSALVHPAVEFDLRQSPDYGALAKQLGKASAYLILANGYDSAQIGQKLALAGNLVPLLGPPWAMTPDVISLGGRQVERMVFVSIYDSQSRTPRWLEFKDHYIKLYGDEPGFAAVYAKDALSLLVQALKQAPTLSPEDVRQALRTAGEISGLQSQFRLDETGDVVRDLFLLTVREGRFVRNTP